MKKRLFFSPHKTVYNAVKPSLSSLKLYFTNQLRIEIVKINTEKFSLLQTKNDPNNQLSQSLDLI